MGSRIPPTRVGQCIGNALLLAVIVALGLSVPANAQSKACGLATPAELEAVLGAKVSSLKGGAMPGGNVDMCNGESSVATVMLRWAKRSGQGGGAAAQGIEMAKKMGAQVEVKTFGPITCSTMIPPKSLEQYGFNTTCAVTKPDQVAAIEITAKSQKDMVPIAKLRPLAEKIAGRF